MAAEQMSGRLCVCGCQQPIERGRKNAAWRLDCRAKRDSELHAERHRSKVQKVQRQTPHPRSNCVRTLKRVSWRDDPTPNRRQNLCKVCFGMPWARRPDRCNDGHGFQLIPVTGDNGLCTGCGEPWGPEPEPERGELITSSAGMIARHAELESINYNIPHEKKAPRNGR